MKKNIFLKILLFATILLSNALFADGSKDLYPSGAPGLPAYLQSSTESTVNWVVIIKDRNYHFKYNPLKTLDEQNVSKQAKIIIGLLFRDYWATEEQKSKIVAKQNYEREKLIKEQKNLFKYKNRNMKESEIINCEEKFLQEPKDNIFKRIFKRIKCIFKLKN